VERQRPRFYYGWVIVGATFIAAGFASGISIWSISIFVAPMTDELGWSRTSFFAALTIRSVIAGLLAPIMGPWLDTKHGPRLMALGGAIALGASLASLSLVTAVWQFWLLYGVLGAVTQMGSGFVIAQTVVPKWFVRKRGRALGITTIGTGLGSLIFPVSVSALVNAMGWRDAWLVLSGATVLVLAPLALLLRTRPEDMGLLPDGDLEPLAETRAGAQRSAEQEMTRGQAMRTPAFWLLAGSFSFITLGLIGFQSNWFPFLQEAGFTDVQASTSIALYGALSGISRPFWGLAGERVPVRYLLAGIALLTGMGIIWLLNVEAVPMLYAYMGITGLIMGGYVLLQPLITANYFGRRHLGSVSGTMRPIMTASAALSPLMIGVLYDLRGGYTLAFLVSMAAWLTAAGIVLIARPPQRALSTQSAPS
jgi:sugar phosphate permease